jgi:hypothetical protein
MDWLLRTLEAYMLFLSHGFIRERKTPEIEPLVVGWVCRFAQAMNCRLA